VYFLAIITVIALIIVIYGYCNARQFELFVSALDKEEEYDSFSFVLGLGVMLICFFIGLWAGSVWYGLNPIW